MKRKIEIMLATCAAMAVVSAAQAQTAAPAASAATADTQGLQDIVVTATRMGETKLQSTPLAVTALNATQLAERGVRDVQDLRSYVPSLQVSDLGGYSQLFIRGIGSNIVFVGSDPSTTIHLDGVYLGRPLSYLNGFLDVDRVEVLRGPQGTLYGRNSVGGTINIVSRTPSDHFEGEIQGQYGTYDRYGVQGYVTGPITGGGIAGSLAFDVSGHGPYLKNVASGDDVENLKSRGVRGQLLVPVGSNIRWTLRADWSRQSGALGIYPKLLQSYGNPTDDAILGDFRKVALDGPNDTILENYGFTSDLAIDLGSAKLRALTAYRGFRGSILTDADSSSYTLLRNNIDPIRQHQFSQELTLNGKLGRLDYVAGAYYFEETDREPLTLTIYPNAITHIQRPQLYAQSVALYGQGEYHLTDTLSVVAGLRWTTERKHWQLDDYYTLSTDPNPAVSAAALVLPGAFAVDTSRRDHAFTPKFGVNFKPNDRVLLYASATRGFKSGGYDYGAVTAADSAAGYGPEKLWSYEVGIKSDWLDRRLRLNLDAFYYDYTDLQVESYVQNQATGSFGAITQNAATAHVKGIEAEIVAKPTRSLQLTANIAYLDARYARYPTAYVTAFGTFDASDKRLNNAPKWSATLSADYSFDLAGHGKLFAGVDTHLQSTIYFTAANAGVGGVTDYGERQTGYGLLNARLGWVSEDGQWKVMVTGTNLTDRNYITGTAVYVFLAGRPGRPREVFGQISRKF